MLREKIKRVGYQKEVIYTEDHWKLLKEKRTIALKYMEKISYLSPIVHGSIARGDIHKNSDIDIVLLRPVPSYKILSALNIDSNYEIWIIQATPKHTPKVKIVIPDNIFLTYPLLEFMELEHQFYKFGGLLTLDELKKDKRVAGVNKKLLLIKPTKYGHVEISAIENPSLVASIVGVNLGIVEERIRVLRRRDEIGRTGIFLKVLVPPDKSPEQVFDTLLARKPTLRRLLRKRGEL